MRILRAVVFPFAPFMTALNAEIPDRRAVGSQIVRHQEIRNHRVFLEKLAHQLYRGALVSLGLNQHVKNFAFSIDSAPKVHHRAVDLQVDFVQILNRMRLRSTPSQIRRDDRTEMVHPAADGLVAHGNPALSEQILDVAQAEREPEIQPDRLTVQGLERSWAIKIVVILAAITGVALFVEEMWRLPDP
jgi:hypothetical protein